MAGNTGQHPSHGRGAFLLHDNANHWDPAPVEG